MGLTIVHVLLELKLMVAEEDPMKKTELRILKCILQKYSI